MTRSIPPRAELSEVYTGTVPEGPRAGERATLQIWTNRESHGYQTDFTHVEVRYLKLIVNDRTAYLKRYSGARLRRLESEIKHFRSMVTPDPA